MKTLNIKPGYKVKKTSQQINENISEKMEIPATLTDNFFLILYSSFVLFLRLFIVMGVVWIMESISFLIDSKNIYFFFFDMWNCLQGVLIFAFMVCKRRVFELIKKRFVIMILLRKTYLNWRFNSIWIVFFFQISSNTQKISDYKHNNKFIINDICTQSCCNERNDVDS